MPLQPPLPAIKIIISVKEAEIVAGLIGLAAYMDVLAPEVNNLAITLALQCPHLVTATDGGGNLVYPAVSRIFREHQRNDQ